MKYKITYILFISLFSCAPLANAHFHFGPGMAPHAGAGMPPHAGEGMEEGEGEGMGEGHFHFGPGSE